MGLKEVENVIRFTPEEGKNVPYKPYNSWCGMLNSVIKIYK